MSDHRVVSHDAWMAARVEFLEREKAFTQARDALSAARRALPWERIEKAYQFTSPAGRVGLADLFDGRSQLIVQHFMFGPDWDEGCKSCSFWADSYDRSVVHLNHRDVTFVAVSRAPAARLLAYRERMGWTFPWVSSEGSDFSFDFQASYTPKQIAAGRALRNFTVQTTTGDEHPGTSVFFKDATGAVFHTYSCYQRGLDMLNGAYNYLDLAPKGRDEEGLSYTMEWLRRRDQYDD